MAENRQLSQLMLDAYEPQGKRQGFDKYKPYGEGRDLLNGLRIQAYINETTKEVVIGTAGTNGLDDFQTFVNYTLGGYHDQFRDALDYAHDIKGKIEQRLDAAEFNFSVTGHSHGGGIAQLLAYTYRWDGATFEAPTASAIINSQGYRDHLAELGLEALGSGELINYYERGSLVSSVPGRGYIGDQIELDLTPDTGSLLSGAMLLQPEFASKLVGAVGFAADQWGEGGQHKAAKFAEHMSMPLDPNVIVGWHYVSGSFNGWYRTGTGGYTGQGDWAGRASPELEAILFAERARRIELNRDLGEDVGGTGNGGAYEQEGEEASQGEAEGLEVFARILGISEKEAYERAARGELQAQVEQRLTDLQQSQAVQTSVYGAADLVCGLKTDNALDIAAGLGQLGLGMNELVVSFDDGSGFLSDTGVEWTQAGVSAANFLDDVAQGDELGALSSGVHLLDDIRDAQSEMDVPGVNTGLTTALSLYNAIDSGDAASIGNAGFHFVDTASDQALSGALNNAFDVQASTTVPYASYAMAGVQLVEGDVEQAGVTALGGYLMSTGNPYLVAAGAVLSVFGGSLFGNETPRAWADFRVNDDGTIGVDVDSNDAGGSLEDTVAGLADGLAPVIANVRSYGVDILPSALPRIGIRGDEYYLEHGGATRLIEDPAAELPLLMEMNIIGHWMLENGIDLWSRSGRHVYLGDTDWSHSVEGTGVFAGGGQKQHAPVSIDGQHIASLNDPRLRRVAQQLSEVQRTWRVDKNLFAGEGGALLAVSLGAGLVQYSEIADAISGATDFVSLMDHPVTTDLATDVDTDNIIAAGYGIVDSGDAQDTDTASSENTGELETAFAPFYSARRSSVYDDALQRFEPIEAEQIESGSTGSTGSQPVSLPDGEAADPEETAVHIRALANDNAQRLPPTPGDGGDGSGGGGTGAADPGDEGAGANAAVPVSHVLNVVEDRYLVTSPERLLEHDDEGAAFLSLDTVQNGTVELDATGGIRFTPTADFHGQAGFAYQVRTAAGGVETRQVQVTVAGRNDRPQAVDDLILDVEDQAIPLERLLANDQDVDDDPLHITAVSQVDRGRVEIDASGAFWYIPAPHDTGDVELVYLVEDPAGARAAARATLSIEEDGNDPPVVPGVVLDGGLEDQDYRFHQSELLADAHDPEGGTLRIESITAPAGGAVAWDRDSGEVVFIPAADSHGLEPVEFEVSDPTGQVTSATAHVAFENVPDPFTAGDTRLSVDENQVVVFTPENLLPRLNLDSPDSAEVAIVAVRMAKGMPGRVNHLPDGSVQWIPPEDYNGPSAFEVRLFNGIERTVSRVELDITEFNDPPRIRPDTFTALEDQTFEFNVSSLLANDIDPEGDAFTLTAVQLLDAQAGALWVDPGTGAAHLEPAPDFFGEARLEYTVTEEVSGLSSTGRATVAFAPVDDSPVITDKTFTLNEDESVVYPVGLLLDETVDADGETVSITAVRSDDPARGAAVLHADGGIQFIPSPDFSGQIAFEFDYTDGVTAVTARVDLTVVAVNDAPVGQDHQYIGALEDQPFALDESDLLVGATDEEGDAIVVESVTLAAGDTGQLDHDPVSGRILYTPAVDFYGEAHLDYTLRDARGTQSTATASIIVQNVEDDFELRDRHFTVAGGEPRIFTPGELLASLTDADGDVLTLTEVRINNANAGKVALLTDGGVLFEPDDLFTGSAQFEYDVTDGTHTHTAVAGLAVQPDPEAPLRLTGAVEDQVFAFHVEDLRDAWDNAATLDAIRMADPATGSLAWGRNSGDLTFTPAPDFFGEALIEYNLTTAGGVPAGTGTATLVVQGVDDPPRVTDKDLETPVLNLDEDEEVIFAASTLLDRLIDVDGEALRITDARMRDDSQGQVSVTIDGGIRFEPAADRTGEAPFEIEVTDGHSTVHATMTPMLWPVNDAPRVQADLATMDEDTTLVVAGVDLLANDDDVDGPHEDLRIIGPWAASSGHARYDAGADELRYTSAADTFGSAWVDYLVEDAHGAFSVARLDVSIDNVYDPVRAMDDVVMVQEDTDHLLEAAVFTGNDHNPDQAPLEIVAMDDSGLTHGQLTLMGDGRIDYRAEADYAGQQRFTYTVEDESGHQSSAAVRLVIEDVNDAPRITRASEQLLEDQGIVFDADGLLDNAVDVEDDWLQVVGARSAQGTVAFDAFAGEIAFTPSKDLNSDLHGGSVLFEYLVQDEKGAEFWGAVDIDIVAINDAPQAGDDVLFAWESGPVGYTNPVQSSSLLVNDIEVDGEAIRIDRVTAGAHGIVALNRAGNRIDYQAEAGFVGQDTFTYRVTDDVIEADGAPSADTGTVSVQVLDNRAPVAHDFATIAVEDTVLDFGLDEILAHVDDPDLGILELPEDHRIVAVGDAVNGQATLNADGGVRFTPEADYNSVQHGGTASFTYMVEDIVGNRTDATAAITYTSRNDAPVAVDDVISQTIFEEQTAVINISDLLDNDYDVDDKPGESSVVFDELIESRSDHGSITVQGDQIRYIGDRDYFGGDSFQYRVVDNEGDMDTGTVHLQVTNVNDAPVVEFDIAQADDSGANTIGGLLDNDIDADGDRLRIVHPSHGSVVNDGTAIRFDADNRGHDYNMTITYGVTDGQATVQTRLDVQVLHVNRPPTSLTQIQTDSDSVFVAGNDPDTPDPTEKWLGGSVNFMGYTWNAEAGIAPGSGAGQNGLFIDLRNQFNHPVDWPDPNQAVISGTGTFTYYIEVSDGENEVPFNGSISTSVSLRNTNFLGVGKPVVIDLNRNGLELLSPNESDTTFDWNDDGWKESTGWLAGQGDALLAYDHDGDQRITQSSELSFVQYMEGAQSDLEGLRAFDTNHDGLFDDRDDQWSQFGLWLDDGDAVSDVGEFVAMTQSRIDSLSLTSDENDFEMNDNTVFGQADVMYDDGSVGKLGDVAFATVSGYGDADVEVEKTAVQGNYDDDEGQARAAANEMDTGDEEGESPDGDGDNDLMEFSISENNVARDASGNTHVENEDSDSAAQSSVTRSDDSTRMGDDVVDDGVSTTDRDAAVSVSTAEVAYDTDAEVGSGIELPADEELDRMAQSDASQAAVLAPLEFVPPVEIEIALNDSAGREPDVDDWGEAELAA